MTVMDRHTPGANNLKKNVAIKKIMLVSIVILILGTSFLLLEIQPWLPIFDPLPPSQSLPSEEPFWDNSGNLSISAMISCRVMDTHRWDSFSVNLILRINNTRPTNILGFHPVKLSIFSDTHWHYFTFGLVPSTNITIEAFSNVSLSYDGDRILDTIEGITRPGYIIAYGRVLISYGGHETIITTSTFSNIYPIE